MTVHPRCRCATSRIAVIGSGSCCDQRSAAAPTAVGDRGNEMPFWDLERDPPAATCFQNRDPLRPKCQCAEGVFLSRLRELWYPATPRYVQPRSDQDSLCRSPRRNHHAQYATRSEVSAPALKQSPLVPLECVDPRQEGAANSEVG